MRLSRVSRDDHIIGPHTAHRIILRNPMILEQRSLSRILCKTVVAFDL